MHTDIKTSMCSFSAVVWKVLVESGAPLCFAVGPQSSHHRQPYLNVQIFKSLPMLFEKRTLVGKLSIA
eukprot:6466461-Amphidinium_carterae.1